MALRRFSSMGLVLSALWALSAAAQDASNGDFPVSQVIPVRAPTRVLRSERPGIPVPSSPPSAAGAAHTNSWQLLATLPDAIIHDLVFVTAKLGYAAAENGQVWKTRDGGVTWSLVLNLGTDYFFYGVAPINAEKVVVSGFIDAGSEQRGVIRWSQDGGANWTEDIVLPASESLQRVRFTKSVHGIILNLSAGLAQETSDGGAGAADWNLVTANPEGNWFGLQFTLLDSLRAYASGINFCTSQDGGAAWTCGPSVDPVFDGPVLFRNAAQGWVGGGEIAPHVEGWVHVTSNGGKNWSGRTLDGPWPIRELVAINSSQGWAAGGNIYTGVGGIYYTGDGGNTWSVDATTNAEMDACDQKPVEGGYRVWCAGYDASYNGYIYSALVP
jgi:photosystem II stability/assembly factor-like uncharacterized protein